MSDFNYLKQHLNKLKAGNLLRKLTNIDSAQGPIINIDGKNLHLFASNNYLSLANHPDIIKAAHKAIDKYGYGAAASRLISGTMSPHTAAENALADFTEKPAALIFPSGWTANEAVIKTIPQKGDLLLLDKLNHASIIDAAVNSPAEFRTFRRDNLTRLEKLLADPSCKRKFIITESVFSMDGDTADLKTLVYLKNKYNAYVIVDEAHSFGCMGPTGSGLAAQLGILADVDIFIATLSKAFAATGGLVASSQTVIDYLINKARPFIYTTAPSPVNAAVILKALEIIKSQPHKRQKLKENSDYLHHALKNAGFNTGNSTTHIIPVIIGSEEKTLDTAQKLFENGFYIPAIRPPTVAPGTCRLRISLQSDHTKDHIDSLINTLKTYLLKKP